MFMLAAIQKYKWGTHRSVWWCNWWYKLRTASSLKHLQKYAWCDFFFFWYCKNDICSPGAHSGEVFTEGKIWFHRISGDISWPWGFDFFPWFSTKPEFDLNFKPQEFLIGSCHSVEAEVFQDLLFVCWKLRNYSGSLVWTMILEWDLKLGGILLPDTRCSRERNNSFLKRISAF